MKQFFKGVTLTLAALAVPFLVAGVTLDDVNVGSSPGDGTGDTARAAFQKINANNALIEANLISDVVEDTTPQLGGDLDVNGNDVTSTSNGNIVLDPNGTGNIELGNFEFDGDQTVGAGQDNYVLTYDNGSGVIALEAVPGGGDEWGDPVDADIIPDGDGTRDLGATATRFAEAYTDALAVTNNIVVGGTVDGRDIAADGTVLDGIEPGADITDATNVNAAGAVMESDYSVNQGILFADGAGSPASIIPFNYSFLAIPGSGDDPQFKIVSDDQLVGRNGTGDLQGLDPADVVGIIESEVDARVAVVGASEDWQSEAEVDARVSTVVPTIANARTWNTGGLQDDEVAVIDFGSGLDGALLIHENSNTPVANGFFTFNCYTGQGRVTSIVSNGITITTGALTGTTGSDGNITLSAFENKIYLENRSGGQLVAGITVMGRTWAFSLTSNSGP